MLKDQDANIRKSGIKIIKKLRSNPPKLVKLVTEVSGEVYGKKKQREKAVAVLASRRSRKAYESMRDYKVDQ